MTGYDSGPGPPEYLGQRHESCMRWGQKDENEKYREPCGESEVKEGTEPLKRSRTKVALSGDKVKNQEEEQEVQRGESDRAA